MAEVHCLSLDAVDPPDLQKRFRIDAFDIAVAFWDGAIIIAWTGGEIGALGALAAHWGASAALCGTAAAMRRRVTPHLACRLAMLLLLGPFSGPAILVQNAVRLLEWGGRRGCSVETATGPARPQPAQAEALFAAIRQGRRPKRPTRRIESFIEVFAKGDLQAQNAAIAAISRHYRPEMLPALMAALDAPVPAVRVQAAAVYAKLREAFTAEAKALLAADLDRSMGRQLLAAHAAECRHAAASGFLDERVVLALRARAEAAEDEMARHPPATRIPRARLAEQVGDSAGGSTQNRKARMPSPLARPPMLKRHACGGIA